MKTLYVIRHAKATHDPTYNWDFERPLDARGLKEAPAMAKHLAEELKSNGCKLDLIISSPSARTLSTARFFAIAFEILETEIVQNKNLYEASLNEFMEVVYSLPENIDAAVIVGHNPSVSLAASLFSKTYIDHIPTCGIVKIEAAIASWKDFKPGKAALMLIDSPKLHQ